MNNDELRGGAPRDGGQGTDATRNGIPEFDDDTRDRERADQAERRRTFEDDRLLRDEDEARSELPR